MNTLRKYSEYMTGIVLAAFMTIIAFALFAEIAVNGTLGSPIKTFTALGFAGVALLSVSAIVGTIAADRREG